MTETLNRFVEGDDTIVSDADTKDDALAGGNWIASDYTVEIEQ